MLTTTYIRENKETVLQGLRIRNWTEDKLTIIDDILVADEARKHAKTELDEMLAERNRLSKEIGGLFKRSTTKKSTAKKPKATRNAPKPKAEKVKPRGLSQEEKKEAMQRNLERSDSISGRVSASIRKDKEDTKH